MRQQYHFRHQGSDVLIWDVNKLLALTQHLPIEEIPLAHITELDEAYWYDLGGDSPTCRSVANHMALVQAADLAYPIIVCPEGKVIDGMHRAVKALLLQQHSIKAYRLPVLPEPDYRNVSPDDLHYDD